jgi:hypothetical protein
VPTELLSAVTVVAVAVVVVDILAALVKPI